MVTFINPKSESLPPLSKTGRIYRHMRNMLRPKFRAAAMERELEQLSPFFEALSVQLESVSLYVGKDRFSVGHLKEIFRAQAKRTGCFISSQFTVCDTNNAAGLYGVSIPFIAFIDRMITGRKSLSSFSDTENIENSKLEIGFKQIKASSNGPRYSRSFVALDRSRIKQLPQSVASKLAASLEKIYSWGNHDYFHHLTSDVLDRHIASSLNRSQSLRSRVAVRISDFKPSSVYGGTERPYEIWALQFHQSLFHRALGGQSLSESTTALAHDYRATVTEFLDVLADWSATSKAHTDSQKKKVDQSHIGAASCCLAWRVFCRWMIHLL